MTFLTQTIIISTTSSRNTCLMMKTLTQKLKSANHLHDKEYKLGRLHRRLPALALGLLLLSVLCTQSAQASIRQQRNTTVQTSQEIYLTVSQYELALIHVLADICPPMLNNRQKVYFSRAYNSKLQDFMPYSADPKYALRQLLSRRDYRTIYQNVHAWTTSYPVEENRALCKEFANLGI